MPFDAKLKLKRASAAVEDYTRRKWHGMRPRPPTDDEILARRRDERNQFLLLISAKITGPSVHEMPPLQCEPGMPGKAVFLITTPIAFGSFELSKHTYGLLAKHVGMSMNSVSHWALGVIDRGFGTCYCYDLMSDQMALNVLGKNYFRVTEITSQIVQAWSSCYYIGETTKSHQEILELGQSYMAQNPRYRLLSNNCQDLVEGLVKDLCDGKIISQAKLSEELSLASPKIALDLMVARLRSRVDLHGEQEDSESVKEDVEVIQGLHRRVTEREQTQR